MGIKLPPKQGQKGLDSAVEPLSSSDTIEYTITMEVSPGKGQKAWIKVGTISSVRASETTEQAKARVYRFVEDELDSRLDELGA